MLILTLLVNEYDKTSKSTGYIVLFIKIILSAPLVIILKKIK